MLEGLDFRNKLEKLKLVHFHKFRKNFTTYSIWQNKFYDYVSDIDKVILKNNKDVPAAKDLSQSFTEKE